MTTEVANNIFWNFAPAEIRDMWNRERMALHPDLRAQNIKFVAFHRSKLGRARIEYGIRRYHTWERDLWVAYVNNDYGVKFEIKDGPQSWKALEKNPKKFVRKAILAWLDYSAAIGRTSDLGQFL